MNFISLNQIQKYAETLYYPSETALNYPPLTMADVRDGAQRWERFRDYFMVANPETVATGGRIESSLMPIPKMQRAIAEQMNTQFPGQLFLKCDHQLPLAGSIKARGGIYAVLKYAEELALREKMIDAKTSRAVFAEDRFRDFFANYEILVGSTGNLGISIAKIGRQLGFSVEVHLSAEAKGWKIALLEKVGAKIARYRGTYEDALIGARRKAVADEAHYHLIDDEYSEDLFLGYAVAGEHVREQLSEFGVTGTAARPIRFYFPCGVGGGPGGITFGLKHAYGARAARSYFIEPVAAPGFTVGLINRETNANLRVADLAFGEDTIADGLAVRTASELVLRNCAGMIDGCLTVRDERLLMFQAMLAETEGVFVEISACAGFAGLLAPEIQRDISEKEPVHVVWSTGGSLAPRSETEKTIALGRALLRDSVQI